VQEEDDVLTPFLQQYYSQATMIPPEIAIPAWDEPEDGVDEGAVSRAAELVMTQDWLSRLRGKKVQIKTPKRGEHKGLLDMVGKNARDLLLQTEQHEGLQGDRYERGLAELADVLGLEEQPHRMECYDISHISGTETVASMAVSIDGRPKPEYYRRFKIKSVDGNDDFASMAEVILRRFSKERRQDINFGDLPDLVIIDGGKGQLSSARSIMELLEVGHIATVGLAKQYEWIYKPEQTDPIVLDQKSPAIQILQQIRDEAHRFAITYHRLLRGRRNLSSALDEIPGLGPKGKKSLLNHFELSLKTIMAADREALAAVPGLNKKSAAAVYDWFHPQE
ncbi:MAG: excinuclease ABC subunit C, partial [Peptococcaceae bacterium]|jgi:excinuclease ABC subunit C|nr:excinuclease ABC subunit C [Peptococcaceae bacterium]